MGKQPREKMLLQAAHDGNLRLLKKMSWGLDSGKARRPWWRLWRTAAAGTAHCTWRPWRGRMDVCRYLVEDLRVDIDQINDRGSPLHGAATKGQCEIVELLLSRGIDVDLDSVHGTLLHMAATHKQDGTMKILLEHHADPNKVFNLEDTPLCMTIRPRPTESLECVKLLIKAGADVNSVDSNGVTCVIMAHLAL